MPQQILRWCVVAGLVIGLSNCRAAQRADPAFRPQVTHPSQAAGMGPVIWIDEGHNNIVATRGRYAPFVAVLAADGYRVNTLRAAFTPDVLRDVRVLVIGSALHARNVNNWSLPAPSAFTTSEIRAVHDWVARGGALLLLADHMPFAGAAADLAAAFGVEFLNGYVEDAETWDPIVFHRAAGTLTGDAFLDGPSPSSRVDSVATFDGSAFRAPAAQPILRLGPRHVSYHPHKSWDIGPTTPVRSVDGWLQGASLELEHGRVVVFADATMFSAQIGTRARPKLGMNTPEGRQNEQFLRNVVRWLTSRLGVRV